ncbi:MAG TPA: hypothetical protein VH480_20145, partial [Streptosporangiaceae bacterium]
MAPLPVLAVISGPMGSGKARRTLPVFFGVLELLLRAGVTWWTRTRGVQCVTYRTGSGPVISVRSRRPAMPSIEVRPFRRSDREQLTNLVNTHAAAVVPGLGVSVSAVLSDLER